MTDGSAPLRVIREVEIAAARQIDAARTEEAQLLSSAEQEAREMVNAARHRGRAEAQRRFAAAIDAANQEAVLIADRGVVASEALRATAAPHLSGAIDAMVELLMAPPEERGK